MASKWERLADDLARACADLPAGAVLPSTKQLIAEGRGSRTTVGEAFNELTRRGLVKGVPGKGYVVLPVLRRSRIHLVRQGGRSLGPFGLEGDGRLVFVRQSFGEPLASIAIKLTLPEDALQVVEQLHHVVRAEGDAEDQAILIHRGWYPSYVLHSAGLETSASEDVLEVLLATTTALKASDRIHYRLATDTEADVLGLPPMQAVVQIERLLVNHAGQPQALTRLVGAAEHIDLSYNSPLATSSSS
ncbi:GntR family transcriptional regulator [Kitasatospora purpeofusca]|uniref:GntR family transcriptional regulator n=1 Tax=Kitasatospora purpeofusca TaxID=67352 RepID=UPI0035D6DA16